jgi:hypothetical protein
MGCVNIKLCKGNVLFFLSCNRKRIGNENGSILRAYHPDL